MYPDSNGGGILRLHSTFRHDLKIRTSDEGRVIKTAGAFAKGLLELEGDLPPILVSLVHKEKGTPALSTNSCPDDSPTDGLTDFFFPAYRIVAYARSERRQGSEEGTGSV